MTCPQCGQPIEADAATCLHCGYVVKDQADLKNGHVETGAKSDDAETILNNQKESNPFDDFHQELTPEQKRPQATGIKGWLQRNGWL